MQAVSIYKSLSSFVSNVALRENSRLDEKLFLLYEITNFLVNWYFVVNIRTKLLRNLKKGNIVFYAIIIIIYFIQVGILSGSQQFMDWFHYEQRFWDIDTRAWEYTYQRLLLLLFRHYWTTYISSLYIAIRLLSHRLTCSRKFLRYGTIIVPMSPLPNTTSTILKFFSNISRSSPNPELFIQNQQKKKKKKKRKKKITLPKSIVPIHPPKGRHEEHRFPGCSQSSRSNFQYPPY